MEKLKKELIDKLVDAKVRELQHWRQVRWEGGRLYYESVKILQEIETYDLEIKLYYLQELRKRKFIIQDNLPGSAPDITPEFYSWLDKNITDLQLTIHANPTARRNSRQKTKWTKGEVLTLTGIIVTAAITLFIFYWSNRESAVLEVQPVQVAIKDAKVHQRFYKFIVTNDGPGDIVIRKLSLQNANRVDSIPIDELPQYQQQTIKSKNYIQWTSTIASDNSFNFELQLVTSKGNLFKSNIVSYK